MKKTVKDDYKQLIHDTWSDCDDEMDRCELKGFVTPDNQPDLVKLNSDDRIGVSEVLLIGGYLALNKLHGMSHRSQLQEIEEQLEKVFDGKVKVQAIIPENMPPEIREVVEGLIKVVQESRKKRGGK